MQINIEIVNPFSFLLGLSYKKGKGVLKDKEVVFHEFGIGLFFITIYITVI